MIHFRLKRLVLQSIEKELKGDQIHSLSELLTRIYRLLALKQECEYEEYLDWAYSELFKQTDIVINSKHDLVCKCSTLFNSMTFFVRLEHEELKEKIIVPGSRFIPFINPMIQPSSLKIRTRCTNGYLQAMRSSLKLKTIANTIYLYERQNMVNLFLDHDKGWNHTIDITTFDISEFINKNELSQTDYLTIKVDCYDRGLCSLSHTPQSEVIASFTDLSIITNILTNEITTILADSRQPHTQEFVLKSALLGLIRDQKKKTCYDLTLLLRSIGDFRLEEKNGQQYFLLAN